MPKYKFSQGTIFPKTGSAIDFSTLHYQGTNQIFKLDAGSYFPLTC